MHKLNIGPGQTFLRPSGSKANPHGKHFFIVLTHIIVDPKTKRDCTISVPLNTLYPGAPYDPACVLDQKEHEWIQHKSFVSYHHTTIDPIEELMSKLQ